MKPRSAPGRGLCFSIRLLRWKQASAPPIFFVLTKKTGRARSKRKALRGSPKMTSPGHFGGHVLAERLCAVTLRPLSGSRRGAVNVSAFRCVWRLLRREGGSGHLALLFCCRPLALPEESGAAAKREAGDVRDLPRSCGSMAKRLLEPRKTVGNHGHSSPAPGKPEKVPRSFSARGRPFSSSFFFGREKEGPPCGQHPPPPPRARHVSRRPQTAYSPSYPEKAEACGRLGIQPPSGASGRERCGSEKRSRGCPGPPPFLWFRGKTALGASQISR